MAHPGQRSRTVIAYLCAVLAPALATAAGWLLYHGPRWPGDIGKSLLSETDVLMLYLLGVLGVAVRFSRGPAVVASVLSVAAFDFFFVPKYLTFAVDNLRYLVTFAVMLATGLTISSLTHHLRQHASSARQAWQQAEAEFLRNTLLSAVSHDLRTPLASIASAAENLVDSGARLPAEVRSELLRTIGDEADRMERLVGNLLEMSRLESGGLVLKRAPVHIQDVVGAALRHLQKCLRDRTVQTDISGDLPLLNIDDVAVEQVLVNLLNNAVEYSPASESICLSARSLGAWVEVRVRDHGPGLPPGAEERIFDKFFRVSPFGPGRPSRGAGLGLAICKAVVQGHGGCIDARTLDDGGAEFRFTLPVAANASPPDGGVYVRV